MASNDGERPSGERYEIACRRGTVTYRCLAVRSRLAARSPQSRLEIRVLGPLEVVADGQPLVVDTRKALAILVLLAVEGRPFAREELAAMLWPESDDESARGALRRTLSVLRTALDGRWLVSDRSSVALQDHPDVDLGPWKLPSISGDQARLEDAASSARGPFLVRLHPSRQPGVRRLASDTRRRRGAHHGSGARAGCRERGSEWRPSRCGRDRSAPGRARSAR